MRTHRNRPPGAGFTAVEMLVVVAIVGILAAMGIPWLQNVIHRTKMEGLVTNLSIILRQARSESIKQNVTTVVRFDTGTRSVESFADRDGAATTDPPDGVFNPVAGEVNKTTDYRIGAFPLPGGINYAAPNTLDVFDGFTTVDNNGTDEDVAIFNPDGSITDVGAIRLGDGRGNFFEVRVAPQSTARVLVLKWDDVEEDWFEKGEDGHQWQWL